MNRIKEHKKFKKLDYNDFFLAADVGGTNITIGIFGVKNNKENLLLEFHYKSQELNGIEDAIKDALTFVKSNFKIDIKKACLAVAGVISPKKDFAKITNIRWDIDSKIVKNKTGILNIKLINDFEAIGYGINTIEKSDYLTIKKGQSIAKALIVIVGAGTGLGKCLLIYDENKKFYFPVPSEGGHIDFGAKNKEELELIDFIKKELKTNKSICFEHVLSGNGISIIYKFLSSKSKLKNKIHDEIAKNKFLPELISKYRHTDQNCKKTFEMFKEFYARFAKNFAIDSISLGGLYIAGGIAPKNKEIFDKNFIKSFEDSHKMNDVLKKIPIYLITNKNISLKGAAFVCLNRF